MEEIGIDISSITADLVDDFLDFSIDIVITVCDNANQAFLISLGNIVRIHCSIKDSFAGWRFKSK